MEKRSRRRIRDLVALAAFQGLSQNEIGCARISMMARSTIAPRKGRIQKRKTTLHLFKSGLQRTAGPYKVPGAEDPSVYIGLKEGHDPAFGGSGVSVVPCSPRDRQIPAGRERLVGRGGHSQIPIFRRIARWRRGSRTVNFLNAPHCRP